MEGTWIERWPAGPKRENKMSGPKFSQHLLAAIAAVLMSSIAVGAAIAPAHVAASTVEVVTYA